MPIAKDFGKYTIEKELGKGGMAVVYLGVHKDLGRKVALKVMHPHLAADKDARIRFENEAKAIACLEHVNILQIYDFGGFENNFYIAMELIDGKDAEKVVKENGPLPPEIAAIVFNGISNGLYQAHAHGIIHRDIKLSNIILKNDGLAKLTDFGIVKMEDSATLTQPDSIVGTPYYIAPEQVDGAKSSVQSDIYALGISMYFALTGAYPFKAETLPLVLAAIASGKYTPLREAGAYVPTELAVIVEKCLARDPRARYENALLIAQDLNSFLYRKQVANDAAVVADYLKNPGNFARELKARSIRNKFERAKSYRDKDLIFEALQEFESILQEDPDNAEVKSEISRLGEIRLSRSRPSIDMATVVVPRNKSRFKLFLAGALLLVGIGLLVGIRLTREGPEPPAAVSGEWYDSVFTADPAAPPALQPEPPAPPPPPAAPPQAAPSRKAAARVPTPSIRKAPAPVPEPTPAVTPIVAAATPAPAAPCKGYLFIISEIWGTVYLDGSKIGAAPTKTKLEVGCGDFSLRIENPAGRSFTLPIKIVPNETLRLQAREADFK